MKKSTIIATSIVCGGLMLFGCTNPAAPANITDKLERNLTALTNVVNRLDTIENSYLSNPDIHPTTTTVSAPAPNSNKKVIAKIGMDNYTLSIPINNKYKNKIANIDTYKTNKQNQDNTSNFYYYNIQPSKYSPRYIGTQNNENEDYLKHYINKVRTLYSITNDAIEANNELGKYKSDVITYCVEIKQLNSAIENGTFVPSANQIAALNNYIDDIKVTIKRIKDCNGDLSNEVNNINNKDIGGITAGIDVINSNYLSVLNHIDTRISYLKNAITTLEQIKYILQEAQEIIINNPTTLEELENNKVADFDINSETLNNASNFDEVVEENDSIENNTESTDNLENAEIENISETEKETVVPTESTDSQVENNVETNNDNKTVNNIATNSSTDSIEENKGSTNTTNNNVVEELENNESFSTEENNDITTNNENNDKPENNQNTTEDKNISNIDTYLNTNNNLDTYKTTQNDLTENNIDKNINTTNEETTLNNINNTNPITTPPIVNGNNVVNNGAILPTDNEKINAPNGTFQNGIITQNNLNHGVNNGVNGTTTGYSGSNNSPIVNNNIRTNKNVDTYGHNTIIDMINHGTVNNGINTLSVSDESKPTMVNSIATLEENYEEELCEENCFDDDCETCGEANKNLEETDLDFDNNNSTM